MKQMIRSCRITLPKLPFLLSLFVLLLAKPAQTQAQTNPFITTWKTTTGNESITINTAGGSGISDFDFTIDWGDGTEETITGDDPDPSHSYATAGTYTVEITGVFPLIYSFQNLDMPKLQSIEQWGDIEWESMSSSFRDAKNMELNATDVPDLAKVTSMSSMFQGAEAFNGDVSSWDVSSVTSMSSMFQGAEAFNGDVSSWNVSSVTSMVFMFSNAAAFDGDVSKWDVSSVTNMNAMFRNASVFNGDLSSWDVSSVTNMNAMFYGSVFNGDVSSWDVSSVRDMRSMFFRATAFNGDVSSWDVSSVTNMERMFWQASLFNQDLSSWNVSSVMNMGSMFVVATAFKGDVSSWDVSSVTNMGSMFGAAAAFNGDVSSWDVSSVMNMNSMFAAAAAFNGDVSSWDVSSVTNMNQMFNQATVFNGNLSSWDVSNVTNMNQMFNQATVFNGNLSSWDVSSVMNMAGMFDNSALSTENYDSTLIGWSQLNLRQNVRIGVSGLVYCKGSRARQNIIDNFKWGFVGDNVCKQIPEKVNLISPNNGSENENIIPEFRWNSGIIAQEYKLLISDNRLFESIIDSVIIEDTVYTISKNLSTETDYYWKVRALNESGASDWSETFTFTTGIIKMVELIEPIDGRLIEPPIILKWKKDSESDLFTFNIHVSAQSNFSDSVFYNTLNDTTLELNSSQIPSSNEIYYWRVRRQAKSDPSVTSGWSTSSFEIGLIPPTLKSPFTEVSVTPPVTISWSPVGREKYQLNLQFSDDEDFSSLIVDEIYPFGANTDSTLVLT